MKSWDLGLSGTLPHTSHFSAIVPLLAMDLKVYKIFYLSPPIDCKCFAFLVIPKINYVQVSLYEWTDLPHGLESIPIICLESMATAS